MLFVKDVLTRRPFDERAKDYPSIGRYLSAHVFCHECGCQTADFDGDCYDANDVVRLELFAVRRWNIRNDRIRDCYDASDRDGRNLYPRSA